MIKINIVFVMIFCVALVSLLQAAAFLLNRSVGDCMFLAASILYALLIVVISRNASTLLKAMLFGFVGTTVLLLINTVYASYVRNELLHLNEQFGHSFLRGIVLYFVLIPVVTLSTFTAAVVHLIFRRK